MQSSEGRNSMNAIYFWEVNSISIIIIGLLLKQLNSTLQSNTMDMLVLQRIMWSSIVLCLSDAISGSLSGTGTSYFINSLVHIGNLVYFTALALIAYFWFCYVNIRLKLGENLTKRKSIAAKIPVVFIIVVILLNPITGFMFSVDGNNTYQREDGIIVHWIIIWAYFLVATIRTACVMSSESNKYRRKEVRSVLYFAIAPMIGSLIQMIIAGTSVTQVGIAISIVVVFLDMQQNQIVTDVLTGLNNRHGLHTFMYNTISLNDGQHVYAFMLDLNGFKQINDSYGHMIGDRALQEVSELLKKTIMGFPGKVYLSRIGGDEFVILMYECEEEEVQGLSHHIFTAFEERNSETNEKYMLNTSIGLASATCYSPNDIEALLVDADAVMYQHKREIKSI